MSKLTEAIDLIDREIQSIKQVLKGDDNSVSKLKLRVTKIMERKLGGNEDNISMTEQEQPSSQLSQSDVFSSQGLSTPQSKSSGANALNEDFPSSPTLEQLGLSGPALSIVGGRRLGFDSSVSNSDVEYDNSFYQKSPVAGVDNSFSSDVSVPNFRLLNSSPISSIERRGIKRMPTGTKTNLKQVTTAQSVLVDFDSSILTGEESSPKPASKRVHFEVDTGTDTENKMIN